jgi:hypothetical protein
MIRLDLTLIVKGAVPVNSRLRAGLRTLAQVADRGADVISPLVWPPARAAPIPPPLMMLMLLPAPIQWVCWVPPAGRATCLQQSL